MPKIEGTYFFGGRWWADIGGQLTGNNGAGFDSQEDAVSLLNPQYERLAGEPVEDDEVV
jgi:hypothetical protein